MTATSNAPGARTTAPSEHPRILAVVGPTGVGKTAVAEDLATALDGEIVSADSMQVYRGMDVGTAKPPLGERKVPHHLLDVVDPGAPFSAALYQRLAREAIADIAKRGHTPIVCGGTGLYVRAALDDMHFPSGDQTSTSRQSIETLAREIGPEALHELLRERDPESAAVIHPNNVRRTIRALEMVAEGVSYAEQALGFTRRAPFLKATYFGLTMRRDALYAHIDARVDAMLTAGLLEEIEQLLDAGFRDALTAGQAIGYKELLPAVEEAAPLGEAIAAIKQASRRYAKRQLTWFRADERIQWIDVTELSTSQAASRVLELLESGESQPFSA